MSNPTLGVISVVIIHAFIIPLPHQQVLPQSTEGEGQVLADQQTLPPPGLPSRSMKTKGFSFSFINHLDYQEGASVPDVLRPRESLVVTAAQCRCDSYKRTYPNAILAVMVPIAPPPPVMQACAWSPLETTISCSSSAGFIDHPHSAFVLSVQEGRTHIHADLRIRRIRGNRHHRFPRRCRRATPPRSPDCRGLPSDRAVRLCSAWSSHRLSVQSSFSFLLPPHHVGVFVIRPRDRICHIFLGVGHQLSVLPCPCSLCITAIPPPFTD